MARTLVRLGFRKSCQALRRRLRRFAVAIVVMFGCVAFINAEAIAATGSCEVQVESWPTRNSDLGELEHVVETAGLEAGEAKTSTLGASEADVNEEGDIQQAFGTQYGGEWYEVEVGDFAVGLASGPVSIQQATEKLHRVLERQVEPHYLAFAEAHVEVRPVPYTPAELKAAAENISQELAAIGVHGASVGLTVREIPGSQSPMWPQVDVIFEGGTTQAACEAAIPSLAKYGSEVTYRRREGINSSAVGEPPTESVKDEVEEHNSGVTGQPTISGGGALRAADDALRAVKRRLRQQSGHGTAPVKTRIRLAIPQAGRLLIRIWMTERTRKLVAVGVVAVRSGDPDIVVLMRRTAFGRRIHGTELYRMTGEIRRLSKHGDVVLAP
jgi:hypothetical protein